MTRADIYLNFIQSLKIRTRDLRIVPLTLNPPQRILWDRYIAPKLNAREKIWLIVLKARREGVSTLIEALMLARTAIDDLVHSLVTAHEAPATRRIWRMAELMVQTSPLASVYSKVAYQIKLGDSTYDIATAGTPDASRGADLTCFHGSEVGFWPNDGVLLSTLQTLPEEVDTICILESTANAKIGDGRVFYEEWLRAVAGESDFTPVFLSWFDMPTYRIHGVPVSDLDVEEQALRNQFHLDDAQLAWRRWCIKAKCGGDLDSFHQEYPSTPEEAFIMSGLPFFRAADLIHLEQWLKAGKRYRVAVNGTFTADPKGSVEVWKEPEDGKQYVIGADSSMGLSAEDRSRSAAQVIDMETLEQVAEYEAAAAPHVFAQHLVGLGRHYNNALIAPEVQSSGGGGGREVLVYMMEQDYYHIHRWRQPDRISKDRGQLYGWETNSRTRPRMIARVREVMIEKSAILHSRKLKSQLSDFGENDTGRLQALSGRDDLLFAWGIALMSRSENYIAKQGYQESGEPGTLPPSIRIRSTADLDKILEQHQEAVLSGALGKESSPDYLAL